MIRRLLGRPAGTIVVWLLVALVFADRLVGRG
jgi:hypothetical protein